MVKNEMNKGRISKLLLVASAFFLGIILLTTIATNGSATTCTRLGYYNDTTAEYSTLIYYDSPTDYSVAKTNYSLASDVLVRGYELDYKAYSGSGPYTAKVSLRSDIGGVTETTSLPYTTTFATLTSYLGGPTYPVDNDPEIIFNTTNPITNCFRLAADTVPVVSHSFNAIYGYTWTTNNAEYIARLVYETIPDATVGTPETGTFNSTDNVDAYAIQLAGAITYRINLDRTSGTGNFNARLVQKRGLTDTTLAITSGSTFPKTVQYTPGGTATFYLMVDTNSFTDAGNYRVNVTALSPPPNLPPNVPVVHGPANNSVIYTTSTLLNATVSDPENQALNVVFEQEVWNVHALSLQFSVPSESTVTYSWTGLNPLVGWYYWQVYADDPAPLETGSGQYRFRLNNATLNHAPTVSVIAPSNGGSADAPSVTLWVYASDLDDDALTVEFYNAANNGLIGTVANPEGLGSAKMAWNGLLPGHAYSWYVKVIDHFTTTTSSTWSFSTASNNPPSVLWVNNPSNGATIPGPNVNLSVYVSDLDFQRLIIDFYNASNNALIDSAINPTGSGNVNMWWNGIAPGRACSWYVIVSDPFNSTTSSTWSFTTQLAPTNNPPSKPTLNTPSHQSTVSGSNVNLNVSVFDADGDSLTVEFYKGSDNSLIGSTSVPSGSGTASMSWNSLTAGQTYSWYVIVSDGKNSTQSDTWTFTVPTGSTPSNPALGDGTYGTLFGGIVLAIMIDAIVVMKKRKR